jgi:predicted metal-dependent phosphotriesterase family hydrolase
VGVTYVQTVTGRLAPGDLGVCDFHEHTLLDWSRMLGRPTPRFDYEEAFVAIRDLLVDFRDAGGRTLVDAGMTWFGPDPWLYLLLAHATGVNIIASIGFFHEMDCPMPKLVYAMTIDELANWLASAITEGIDGTGVKAGVLKAASSSDRITPAEEKAIRAVARAQRQTGAGIITHVSSPAVQSRLGLAQLELFKDEGVDLSKVVIGHMGWDTTSSPLDYHRDIAATGANLGYDQIGHRAIHDDAFWVELISTMVAEGFTEKLFLSHDSVGAWIGPRPAEGHELNRTYSLTLRGIVPELREAGVSEEALETILVSNPRRLLTISP